MTVNELLKKALTGKNLRVTTFHQTFTAEFVEAYNQGQRLVLLEPIGESGNITHQFIVELNEIQDLEIVNE